MNIFVGWNILAKDIPFAYDILKHILSVDTKSVVLAGFAARSDINDFRGLIRLYCVGYHAETISRDQYRDLLLERPHFVALPPRFRACRKRLRGPVYNSWQQVSSASVFFLSLSDIPFHSLEKKCLHLNAVEIQELHLSVVCFTVTPPLRATALLSHDSFFWRCASCILAKALNDFLQSKQRTR